MKRALVAVAIAGAAVLWVRAFVRYSVPKQLASSTRAFSPQFRTSDDMLSAALPIEHPTATFLDALQKQASGDILFYSTVPDPERTIVLFHTAYLGAPRMMVPVDCGSGGATFIRDEHAPIGSAVLHRMNPPAGAAAIRVGPNVSIVPVPPDVDPKSLCR